VAKTHHPDKLPLSATELSKRKVQPERHEAHFEQSAPVESLMILGAAGRDAPSVTTRLVRMEEQGANPWRVEVSVDGHELRPAAPPPLQVVTVDRKRLARRRVRRVAASIPAEHRVAIRPKTRKVPERYRIRFGEIEYDPTTIFPPDGRRAYYDTNYPWCCLVRVTTPRGWSGSGVLIGPRHVVTASHCVDWTPGWLTVQVMYSNTTWLAAANGTLAYASSKVGPGSIPDDESDEDYAVIVLDQPIGLTYGWLGSRTYDSGWDDETDVWHSIGYPQDWSGSGEIAAWQTHFYLNELGADYGSARLIRSDTFDNWPGQSGSPVFGFWDDGPHVVGVVSGQGADYNYISGGSLLPSLVNQARNEHP
jgi:V8-like Glu-specific endopeptidase